MFELDPRKELQIFKQATDEGKLLLFEGLIERANVLMHRWHKKIGYREINNKKKSLAEYADGSQNPRRKPIKTNLKKN